jgi:hypothetical protein
MLELAHYRDVIVYFKGSTFTVDVPQVIATQGWIGGQGFQWVPPVGDQLLASISDGLYGGFALWGSDESSDQFTGMTRNQPTYRYVVLGAGGWLIATRAYEQYTYASRIGPGPLVPLVYQASDRLVFSLRGFWTREDEWTLSGDPRAPNSYFIGFVAQRPTPGRDNFMTIQTSI